MVSILNSIFAQQDVWLQSFSAPNSGCGLTNSQPVNVSIYNNSSSPMTFNSITASYSVDGGAPVNQLIGSTIAAFATVNFTFSVNANLSVCGPHTIKTWVTRPADPDQLNDTLTWAVNNDCVIVPGTITPNPIVCAGLNSGALNLIGSSNGTIINWEMSNDGGTIWSNIVNNTSIFNYTNIPQTRQYRVFIEGGTCPDAYSAIGTLTAIAQPVPGVASGPDSLCVNNATGNVYLTGTSNTVLQWESSIDNGATWSTIANTTYTNNFTNITSSTNYRVLVGGGVCPNTYSDTANIFVDLISGPGIISGSDSRCETNGNGVLSLSGPIGNTLFWQSSINNGLTWSAIANTTNTLNYSGVTQTTLYRAFNEGEFCPNIFSDTAEIYIQALPPSVDITGGDSLCITSVSGTLNIAIPPSDIQDWEFSIDNGMSWTSLVNNLNTQTFSGLTQTSNYRVSLDGGFCPNYYSNSATVYVELETFPGTLTAPDSLCINSSSGAVALSGLTGPISFWESSEDSGLTWTNITNTANSEIFSSLNATTWFRVFTDGGFCTSYYSDTAIIYIENLNIGGTITGDGPYCGNGSGVLNLINSSGIIAFWENSNDSGVTWNQILNNTTTENFTGITTDILYRVFLVDKLCPGTYSDTAVITIDGITQAGSIFPNTSLCFGEDITYYLTGQIGDSIRWETSFNGVLWGTDLNATADSNVITNISQNQYLRVIVTSGVCPPDTTAISLLSVNTLPSVTVSADTNLFSGDSISISGIGGVTGLWTPNINIDNDTATNPTVYPTVDTYYVYHVIDLQGCVNSDTVLVVVYPAVQIDIKNVVTMNGDGYNDTWIIEGLEYFPNTAVKLFNTYGNEIYENTNYANEWDGSYQGKKLPNGTYFYTVQLYNDSNIIKGSLTLLGNE